VGLTFEWDRRKASANRRKHGVSFEEAATVFGDPLSITIPDPDRSAGEERFITMGLSGSGTVPVVAHLEVDDTIRIISARTATRPERRR